MSISALTSEAARLLAYFQGAEASINSQVQAAVFAAPNPNFEVYVDSIAGDDANPGTIASPMRTVDGVLDMLDGKTSIRAILLLAVDGSYSFGRSATLHNSSIQIRGDWNPRNVANGDDMRPPFAVGYNVRSDGYLQSHALFGQGLNLELRRLAISTAIVSPADAGRTVYEVRGILGSGVNQNISVLSCPITINDMQLYDYRLASIYQWDVELIHGAGNLAQPQKAAVDIGRHGIVFSAVSMTYPAGEDIHDFVQFYDYDAVTGRPLGVCTNLELSAP